MSWPERKAYQRTIYEEAYRVNLYGRAEVWLDDRGERELQSKDWINLPFQDAIDIFTARTKILSKEAHRILSDAMKQKTWTIAGDHSDYSREMAKESLETALKEGWSKQRWINHALDTGIPNLGKGHLFTVFQTNILGSYQHGRWKQQHTPSLIKRRPYLRYRTVGDSQVRERHAAMEGFTALRDHPVWQIWYPPSGFLCRCRVEALRKADPADVIPNDQGPPPDPTSETGEPVQPDEGFATNPGEWLRNPGQSDRS